MLHEIGAEVPIEVVLNKIDRVDALGRRRLANRFPGAPQVSALTGDGLDELRAELAHRFDDRWERVRLLVPYDEGSRLSELYALGTPIEAREDTPAGVLVIARLPRRDLPRFAPFLIADPTDDTSGERLIELPIQRLRPDAIVPERAYAGDAGLDLSSCERVQARTGGAGARPDRPRRCDPRGLRRLRPAALRPAASPRHLDRQHARA